MSKISAEEVLALKHNAQLWYEHWQQRQRSLHYQALEQQADEPERLPPVVVEHIYEYKRVDRTSLEIDKRLQGVEKALGNHLSVKRKSRGKY